MNNEAAPQSTIYMDATLRPNRSLSPRAFMIVMSVVAVFSFAGGVFFWSMGAIPVVGFFGLDALAIYLAFRACFRHQEQETRVRVTADEVRVDHRPARGEPRSASLPTAFVRVELTEPVGPTSWITLSVSDRAYVIGRFLAPEERNSFVDALRHALRSARLERYPA